MPPCLDREFGRKRWGNACNGAEELVAELRSAFLSAHLGITAEPRDDHASYLAPWLDLLKGNDRAIFTAAAHAQRAADFLRGLISLAENIVRVPMQPAVIGELPHVDDHYYPRGVLNPASPGI